MSRESSETNQIPSTLAKILVGTVIVLMVLATTGTTTFLCTLVVTVAADVSGLSDITSAILIVGTAGGSVCIAIYMSTTTLSKDGTYPRLICWVSTAEARAIASSRSIRPIWIRTR